MPLTQTRWPLFGALILGALIVALFWWITLDESRGAAVPATGGRYVEGVLRPPARVNPFYAYANPTDADLVALVFSGLVGIGYDGLPVPDLAERWEITNNGQRYVFHLRQGVAWHDGEDLDAEDVLFTYRAIADPGFTGDPALAALMQGVVVTARDPFTIEFQLEQTYAPFLAGLTVGILPKHILGDIDAGQMFNAAFNVTPIGSGPYRVISRNADGSTALEANSTYYFGPPHISEIEVRPFVSEEDLRDALQSGAIDGALIGGGDFQADVIAFTGSEFVTHEMPGSLYYMLYLNTTSPLFNDRDVRTALFQALDRNGIVSAAGGHGTLSDTGVPPDAWAHSENEMPEFSPGDAATTLELEGFARGSDGTRANADNARFEFPILTADDPTRVAIAQRIAEQLKVVGVSASVEAVASDTFLNERIPARDYDAALVLVDPGVDPDPYPFWHSTQIPPPGLNLAGYGDTRIDDTLERARQTTDIARRQDLYALFDGYFIAAMPSLPLFAPAYTYVQSSRVHGYEPRLMYAAPDRFAQIGAWYVETRVP